MSDTATIDVDAVRKRVARGARLLDEREPGWAARVDLRGLKMDSCLKCVLGYVYGDYFEGLVKLEERPLPGNRAEVDEVGFGFNTSDWDSLAEDEAEYAALAVSWRAEIQTRTAEGSARP